MNCYEITAPKRLDADIALPASKSISNRALIIQALAGGGSIPENLSDCDDTRVVINALDNDPHTIDIGAAGTAMRFLTAYYSVTEGDHILTGTERMRHRPIGVLVDALRQLGADIQYEGEEGYPPLHIRGHKLIGGELEIPGNISSQFISALLLVSPMMSRGLELHLTGNIISRPYIDLTLNVMHAYGAEADWSANDMIKVEAKPYTSQKYLIENDWSAASYWYEMSSLYNIGDADVTLHGLKDSSRQGDSIVKYIFSLLGVRTTFQEQHSSSPTTVKLSRHTQHIENFTYDFSNCPDLAQTIVVTCCALDIPFRFTGLGTLRIKETDRLAALEKELQKVGCVIHAEDDSTLVWRGVKCEPSFAPIDTYQDHRMALAFAPLAILYPGLKINNPEVVTKSYPEYWEDLRKAGFTVKTV